MADEQNDGLRQDLQKVVRSLDGMTASLQTATDALTSERRARRVAIGCGVAVLLAFAIIGWVEFDRASTTRADDQAADVQSQYQSCRRGNELRGAIPEATAIASETAIRELSRLNLDPEDIAAIDAQLADIGDSVQQEVAALDGMTLRNCDEILEGESSPSLRPSATTVPTTEAPQEPPPGTTTTTAPSAPPAPFSSCAEARDAGAAPMTEGDPGYSPNLDADGDGIACE